MIKVENIGVWGFCHAIRGMRNPLNSWEKSDSCWDGLGEADGFSVGENDLDLMRRLYKAGTEHRKYLRQIFVSIDITAPLYWWKEFDTYKVGTVANSCSTMHKIHAKEFELDDFSHEHLFNRWDNASDDEIVCFDSEYSYTARMVLVDVIIPVLNHYRQKFLETKDKSYWWQMIQLLPSSYNQRRTVTMTYENAMAMIGQREHHKLDEWRFFTDILRNLPYVKEIRED